MRSKDQKRQIDDLISAIRSGLENSGGVLNDEIEALYGQACDLLCHGEAPTGMDVNSFNANWLEITDQVQIDQDIIAMLEAKLKDFDELNRQRPLNSREMTIRSKIIGFIWQIQEDNR